ncbi:E3 ubiquitin-protein ligase RNF43 isoform X1 [Lacerta agilis]|uniref:E3 ubiquitin-protein ligase RNF43 isoform X1 n=2 Tax=Lacerta agilis TaxID=80427 RepID=UPI00141A2973|nr:E3 ubiquitin-protein ligase RNF43 isoform X1 [Lacerta agilis]
MSVGPQLQLAVLWPWLLMAMLQIRLGYSGLALVAAMEAERSLAQKAIIRVIPLKLEPLTLEGVFASVAEVTPAEGKLLQFHPMSLCNTSEDEHTVPGFVSIVKLEPPDPNLHPCLSLANKAKLAGERGARAVLFDITDDESAVDQLRNPRGLSHPVVLIWGHDAELLMGVVNKNREARVKIEVKEMAAWPDYDVWILLTVMSTVLVIVLIFIVRTRCQPSRDRSNVQEETLQAINQLATRRYQARRRQAPTGDSVSTCSSAPVCAICLEEFTEGQELRIITCFHEFHRHCVDRWLLERQTCPLCMFNIVDRDPSALPRHSHEDPHNSGPGQRPRFFRQHPGRALYHFPRTVPQMPPGSCSSTLPHGHPFFHSPELSQLDLGTMHYLPYRPVGFEPPWCSRQPSLTRGLLVPQRQDSLGCEPGLPSRRTCLLQHQPSCRGLRGPLMAKPNRAIPPHRGIRHGRHHHHHSSGSGDSYLTEPSGYLPDGPGSDSSSGPCHGSSSDSMLNCTDVSLQAIHGSCSTFRSSLSSDYDPFAFCGSEKSAPESCPTPSPSWRDPRPPLVDSVAAGRPPVASSHVHYHHHLHRHHHYGRCPPDCANGQEPGSRKAKPPRAKAGPHGAQAQKRTEKMPSQEGGSASLEASSARQPTCLPQGQTEFSIADRSNLKAADSGAVGPWTSQKRCLQIHPSRRRWKCPLKASPSSLPEDSNVPPVCSVPHPPGPASGSSSCSAEVQPLLETGPSGHLFATSSHSATEPQEQADRLECKAMCPGEYPRLDTMGKDASFYLSCQILQELQGSKDNIPDVYEHSV